MPDEFSKDDYRTLVDLAMIAHWVLHVFETEENPEIKEYDDLIQKIYTNARAKGLDDLVVYEKEADACFPAPDYEEESEVVDLLEDFEDNLFWYGLAQRMALKVLVDQEGVETYDELYEETNAAKLRALEVKFAEEFFENGLNNIHASIDTDVSDIGASGD